MRTVVVFVICAVITTALFAQSTLPWQWLNTAGGDISGTGYTEQPYSLEVDDSGNVYMSGTVGYFAEFDTFHFPGYGSYDNFIAKYSCNGILQWVHTAGGAGTEDESFLGLDESGGIYWSGIAATNSVSSFYIADTSYLNIGVKIFLTKLDASGNFEWIKIIGTEGTVNSLLVRDMLVKQGEIVMQASSGGGEVYPGYPATGQFICKFDLNGNFLGLNNYSTGIGAEGITADPWGNVYICGNFNNQIVFNGDTLTDPPGLRASVISKYDSDLNFLWNRVYTSFYIAFRDMSSDSKGNLLLAGDFTDTLDYGSGIITQNGSGMSFLMKTDSAGNPQWARRSNETSGGGGAPYDVYVDKRDYSYLTGRIGGVGTNTGYISYGTDTFYADGFPFYVAYDSAGNYLNAAVLQMYGGTPNAGFVVAADWNSNVYVGGAFASCIPYNTDTICNMNGTNSIFLAKYGQANCLPPCATPVPNFSITPNELTIILTDGSQLADLMFYIIGSDTLNTAPYIYTFPSNGTYSVCQVVQNACGGSVLCQQVTVTTIGLDIPQEFSVLLYPNPAGNELFIQMSDMNVYRVNLVSTTGKIVVQAEIRGAGKVSLDHVPPGIYFMQAISPDGHVVVGRVVKK